jgi:3-oxoadipate enol-lactonase
MLDPARRRAVARLAAAVLAVKPFATALPAPVRVVPVPRGNPPSAAWPAARWDAAGRLLDRIAVLAGVPGLTVSPGMAFGDLRAFERVVSTRLDLADLMDREMTVADDEWPDVDQIAARAVRAGFDAFFGKEVIGAFDGVPLSVYSGRQGREAVVLATACGMPAALAESWMRFIARDRWVLTWESRGLFEAADYHGDHAIDTAAQAADLFTVMDHHGVPSAHVIGLCGGASIALAAAAQQPGRISSLSLWHGAYVLASGCPKTRHQQDLIELMALAAHSRAAARSVQATIGHMALGSVPGEIAHLALYPYANSELFYRYCRLNGTLATTDMEQYLSRVKQPALVVTSRDDATAHPQGSRQVAELLPNARLRVEPHGDHTSLFVADGTLMQVATDFIADSALNSAR